MRLYQYVNFVKAIIEGIWITLADSLRFHVTAAYAVHLAPASFFLAPANYYLQIRSIVVGNLE